MAEDGGLFAEGTDDDDDGSSSDDGSASSEDEMEKLIAQAADKVTRAEDAAADGGAEQPDTKQTKKKKKMRWKDRQSVFINQLPYSATEEQIAEHFGACAAAEDMEVRRVMNRKNGKFRGIAFIDVKTQEALEKALALDQSEFSNAEGERTINVRKAVDKANESDKELTARQAQKKKAASTSVENIEKLVGKAVASGSAVDSDFDDRAKDFLKTVPEAIATAAIDDFCALDKSKVNNRYAWPPRVHVEPRTTPNPTSLACWGVKKSIIRYTLLHLSRAVAFEHGCIEMRTNFRRFSDLSPRQPSLPQTLRADSLSCVPVTYLCCCRVAVPLSSFLPARGAFFMGLLKRRLKGDSNDKITARLGTAAPKRVAEGGSDAASAEGGRPPNKKQRQRGATDGGDARTCYVCGASGHLARDCPQSTGERRGGGRGGRGGGGRCGRGGRGQRGGRAGNRGRGFPAREPQPGGMRGAADRAEKRMKKQQQ